MRLDENGKSQTAKAGDEFLLMPPMAMIPPGGTQNFRVQWLGDPMIEASQSFYIFFNQVPVKMPKDHKGVQVVVSMGVIANVAPAQGTPSLQVVGTGVSVDKNGKRRPTMTVLNPTKVHALLPQTTVGLRGRVVDRDTAVGFAQRASRQRSRAAWQAPQVRFAGRGSRQRQLHSGERRDAAAEALNLAAVVAFGCVRSAIASSARE